MSQSYEELLDYSKKIIERGDGWKSLSAYLDQNCENLEWKKEIRQKVRDYENAFKVKGHERQKAPKSTYDYVLGIGGILIGITLILIFLNIEANAIWIGTLPFAFIGMGIRQMTWK